VNEEALAHWGLLRQKQTNKQKNKRHFAFACRDSYQVEYTSFRIERTEADGQSVLEE